MTIVVCGSLNMDVIAQSARRPAAGETVLGATVTLLPGGKGLNQAVAAARLGAPTAMIGAVGNDAFGCTLRGVLADEDVDSTGVRVIRGETTGVALIQVAGGDNAITGASGANMSFEARMIRRRPRAGEIWLAQFETPVATTEYAFQRARAAGARTVLNMAPMMPHPVRLLRLVDIAVVNELELRQATGIKLTPTSSRRMIVAACERLRQKGVGAVIATLGARGAMVVAGDRATELPGHRVRVVDTTGAGDCFVGALAAQLSCGIPLLEAARFANAAAACCVEGLGAAPSMPRRKDVAARLPRA
ncbi:MAG: ribokinase [Enhydrobacter sp.]|nr:MAG: ribokinase [Enhydrobacter sp.]